MCYYCDYSISTLILLLFCNLINATYYLEQFTHVYSLHNVFTCLNNEISYKDSIKKPSLLRIIVFFPPQANKSPRKTATRHPVEQSFRNGRVRHIFCKRTRRPQVTNSLVYIEVINFCGSQPCSPSRGQRYYGLIELEPRTSVRKLFKILHGFSFRAHQC